MLSHVVWCKLRYVSYVTGDFAPVSLIYNKTSASEEGFMYSSNQHQRLQ